MRTCISIGVIALCASALHTYSNRPPDAVSRCTAPPTKSTQQGTRVTVQIGIVIQGALVDTGATKTTVPGCIMRTLADRGLARQIGTTRVTMADNSVQQGGRWRTDVWVTTAPNQSTGLMNHEVISIEETQSSMLLGHTTLAALNLLVDPRTKSLIPQPSP